MFKTRSRRLLKCLFALVITLAALSAPGISRAADDVTFNVTLFTDPPVDGCAVNGCSLREAVLEANALGIFAFINLPPGDYTLSIPGAGEDVGITGDLDIHTTIRLVGLGDPGSTNISAQDLDRVIDIHGPTVTVEIWNVTLIEGSSDFGGALRCQNSVLDLRDMDIAMSYASAYGGGLYSSNCSITMENTEIVHNAAAFSGGGMYVSAGSVTIHGGAIGVNSANASEGGGIRASDTTMDITACEILGNQAPLFGGGIFLIGETSSLALKDSLVAVNSVVQEAGGIYTGAGTSMTISNSTISGNISDGFAGGIETRGQTHIEHSTIVNNVSDANLDGYGAGGGLLFSDDPIGVTVTNTILANNDDRSANNFDDCARWIGGTLSSLGYNLVETVGNCSFGAVGDITSVDPLLGELRDNGGTTMTHALLKGSPAIDTGNPAIPVPITDQRGLGFPRVVNERVDIGAFEAWFELFLPLIWR